MSWNYYAKPYVSPAELAKRLEKALNRSGKEPQAPAPVKLNGKTIADTFWGKAWCENLERYSDFENRLPRGRTYVRKGAVAHLHVEAGSVVAFVNGSDLYRVELTIAPLAPARWKAIRKHCSGSIGSLVELLSGKLSGSVMQRICEPKTGLFPAPAEIKVSCSCPDWADVCKHVAAVIYGIGARLDTRPEILFRLRQVDEQDLIAKATELHLAKPTRGSKKVLAADDLSALFGLEMMDATPAERSKGQINARTKRRVPDEQVAVAVPTNKRIPAKKPVKTSTAPKPPGPAKLGKAAAVKKKRSARATTKRSIGAKQAGATKNSVSAQRARASDEVRSSSKRPKPSSPAAKNRQKG